MCKTWVAAVGASALGFMRLASTIDTAEARRNGLGGRSFAAGSYRAGPLCLTSEHKRSSGGHDEASILGDGSCGEPGCSGASGSGSGSGGHAGGVAGGGGGVIGGGGPGGGSWGGGRASTGSAPRGYVSRGYVGRSDGHHVRHFHRGRVFAYVPYGYYDDSYAYGGCGYYYRRALATGSR